MIDLMTKNQIGNLYKQIEPAPISPDHLLVMLFKKSYC